MFCAKTQAHPFLQNIVYDGRRPVPCAPAKRSAITNYTPAEYRSCGGRISRPLTRFGSETAEVKTQTKEQNGPERNLFLEIVQKKKNQNHP